MADDRNFGRDDRPGQGRSGGGPRQGGRGYGSRDDRPRRDGESGGYRGGDNRGYGSRDDRPRRDGESGGYRGGDNRGYGSRDDRPRRDGDNRGYGSRDDRPRRDGESGGYRGGDNRGYGSRDDRPRRDAERGRGDTPRTRFEDRPPLHPGLERKENEPAAPQDVDLRTLPFGVRAELRGLRKDIAETVGAHLIAAGQLIDSDPELALAHAQAARRRAARLPIVREATAETAYAAGDYSTALTEYRALRRMTGGADYLPVMADCERALGRPEAALKLAKESHGEDLAVDMQVEMVLVEAGARDDMGQRSEALRVLKQAISAKLGDKAGQARLRYAYADLLERSGDEKGARQWFSTAAANDTEQLLDAQERIARLDGLVIDFGEDDEDDEDETGEQPAEGHGDESDSGEASDDSEHDAEDDEDLDDTGDEDTDNEGEERE